MLAWRRVPNSLSDAGYYSKRLCMFGAQLSSGWVVWCWQHQWLLHHWLTLFDGITAPVHSADELSNGKLCLKHSHSSSCKRKPSQEKSAASEVDEAVSDAKTVSSAAALAAADIAGPLAIVWEQQVLDRDVLATTWEDFRNNSKAVCIVAQALLCLQGMAQLQVPRYVTDWCDSNAGRLHQRVLGKECTKPFFGAKHSWQNTEHRALWDMARQVRLPLDLKLLCSLVG